MLNTLMMLLLAVMAFLTLTSSAVIRSESADLPHPVGTMNFMGTLGGYEVNLNGSVEEIHAQMKSLHPDFNPNAGSHIPRSPGRATYRSLEERSKYNGNLRCVPIANWGWEAAVYRDIEDGISYLENLGGTCNVGPRSCVRISCSWQSAIWLCNDNTYGIQPSCSYLAGYAIDILDNCHWKDFFIWQSGGQEFDSDGYNIIVRHDPNNC